MLPKVAPRLEQILFQLFVHLNAVNFFFFSFPFLIVNIRVHLKTKNDSQMYSSLLLYFFAEKSTQREKL